jgi:two-component system, cell cycle sensor histidine kinase and response regulator CckA
MSPADQTLQTIFDQAAVGIAQISLDGTWLRVNKRYCQMLGYSEAELRVRKLPEITHPDDCTEVSSGRRDLLQGLISSHSIEKRYIRKDGSVFWGRLNRSLVRDQNNRPLYFIAVVEDITAKIHAERALRDSEQRLVSIYNTVQDVIFHLAVEREGQFRFVSVNTAFMRVTGLSREAVVGKLVNDVIPEPSLTLVLGKYRQAVEENAIVSWEETTDYATGRLTGEVSIAPVLDDKGSCTHLVGSVHDITGRKHAEAALRESEERFRSLANTAPVMVWVAGPDKAFTFFNKTWLDFVGRTLEQEVNSGWVKSVHPDDVERCLANFNAAFDGRESFHIEHRLRRADGEYRWVLCSGVPCSSSESIFAGYIGSATDITDVRRAEQELVLNEALRESEEKYHGIVDTMTEGVWILDSEDRTTFVNQQMASMLGYRVEEMVGRHLLDFKDEEARPMALQKLERRRQGITEQYDSTFRTRDGRRLTALISTRPLWSGEERYAGSLGVITNITERSLLEEQLHQAHKMEAIGRLAGGVAHDFNNLLTVINGRSDLVLRNLALGDQIRADLTEIRIAGQRAQELTSQMLAFSRGQIRATQVLSLRGVVEDVETMLRRMIGEDIKLVTVFDPGLGQIKADRTELTQILLNLAANARDAMPTGGTLTFELLNVEMNESYARSHPGTRPGAYVLLTVVDTGVGMDADIRKHLFEPFFTTKQSGKGTGLGLATVYGIVSQNKGWIQVDSKPRQGTTFRIYWPRVAGAPSKEKDQTALPEQPLYGNETVLVVEDQRQVRELACAILKEFGYQILEASDCEEALRLVEAHAGPLHLLLTDVVMPGISGPELATRLTAVRSLPVLFMSGYSDRMEACQDAETAYIQKPFTAIALLRKVREVLGEREHRVPQVPRLVGRLLR